jgi:hypothetical protein
MEASALLPVLKLGAALAGVGGGVINMWISWDKETDAKTRGDIEAASAYRTAGHAFGATAVTSGLMTVEAGAQTVLKRFAGQRVVVAVAGSIVGFMEVAVVGVTAASVISGVGLVLLGVGIVSTLIAMHELTPLEKWASRSYFGKGMRGPKFANGKQEQAQLDEALAPPQPTVTPEPPPYPTPAYDPRQQGSVQRKSS